MTPRARNRLLSVLLVVFGLGLAAGFALYGLSGKITYFHTPAEIAGGGLSDKQLARTIRVGGLVKTGSIAQQGETHLFTITDNTAEIRVAYRGLLPDLFREGQSVIAYGKYDRAAQSFDAQQILAKHDENYMPREVQKALESR